VPSRPLVITTDPDLLDDLLRLAAASSAEVEVAPDPAAARSHWSTAPLVLVGAGVAQACVKARLPHRAGVVIVSTRPEPGGPEPADEEVWRLADDLGAEYVVFLPEAEAWLVDRFADVISGPPGAGRIVGVVGGRGGAGASVLAAALAVTAARQGLRSMLVDADPLGGGLDLVVGREESPGLRWPALADTAGRVSAPVLFDALPRVGELCVLSWDRGDMLAVPPAAVDAAIDAGRRGSDLVVIDLPRRPDEAAVHALQAADTVLLVVPAEVRAVAAASRVVATIGPHCARLQCVVRGPAPAGLRSRDLAAALGLPLAGTVRGEPGMSEALERGEVPAGRGRGPLAALCRHLLAAIADLPAAA
jgi:secretion/DNA translocation related CpaE-like protein